MENLRNGIIIYKINRLFLSNNIEIYPIQC